MVHLHPDWAQRAGQQRTGSLHWAVGRLPCTSHLTVFLASRLMLLPSPLPDTQGIGQGWAFIPGGGGILGGQGPPSAGKSSWGVGQGRGPRGLGSPGGSLGVLRARAGPSVCPLTMTATGPSALLTGASGACSAPRGFGVRSEGSGGDSVAPGFSEPTFFFLPTLVEVWVEAGPSREAAAPVGMLRSSWAPRPLPSSSAGGRPPFRPPLLPFPAFLEVWLLPPAAWAPGVGGAPFLLQLLFQAETRLGGTVLGLDAEDTRAGKSSSWKVFLPLAGPGYTSASPTGPGAAAVQQEEVEAQRLGKSSSLSFGVGSRRVLGSGREAAVSGSPGPGWPCTAHHRCPPPQFPHTHLGGVGPGPGPGQSSWLTGPFIEASLGPKRHERTPGQGAGMALKELGNTK